MELKRSPLIYHDFIVFDVHLEAVFDNETQKCNFETIPLEIDFDTYLSEEKNNFFNIVLNINGNNSDNPVAGYKFSIVANGIFELKDFEKLKKEKVDQFLLYSALPMLISSVRNYIFNLTSYAPHGKYLLPALDLPALIKQTIESKKQVEEIEEETKN